MKDSKSKYRKQLFICCNEKTDGTGCAPLGAEMLRDDLKKMLKEKGLNQEMRVVKSGCLDYCTEGIAAVMYPEGKTFTEVNLMDMERLFDELTK